MPPRHSKRQRGEEQGQAQSGGEFKRIEPAVLDSTDSRQASSSQEPTIVNESSGHGRPNAPSAGALPRTGAAPLDNDRFNEDHTSDRVLDREADRAQIMSAIHQQSASLRSQERDLIATLHRTRIERQILLNARETIDIRLQELQSRRVAKERGKQNRRHM